MKKYFIHFTAIVTMVSMLLTTSCQQVEKPFSNGKESTVTFTVSTPEMATRAVGDGTTATNLYYGVYDENGQLIPAISKTDQPQTINGTANVELVLVNSDTYSIVFWAENSESVSTIDWVNKIMTFNPTKANIEKYDAFYHYEGPFTVNGALNKEIKLTRPFAQLNIGTKDKTAAANAGLVVTSTQVTISEAADQMDLFTSSVVESTESQVYGYTEIADLEDEDFPVSGNEYLSMNYVLTAKDKQLVDVVFNYKNAAGKEYTRKYDRIPVQRNYRTNIYGALLTDEVDYEVEIVPVFKDPAHTEFVFDGKNYTEVTTEEAANNAFKEGDMSVYLKSITANVDIELPVSTQDVYLALGSTDKKVTVKYRDANGNKPAKVYVTLPEGDVEEMDLQLSSSTVYLSVNGKVKKLTSSTAQNTLYIVNGRVENLAVAQGNVVIENYAGVDKISRTSSNNDPVTKVFASETASLPEKEGEYADLIFLGYPDFKETEEGSGIYEIYTLRGLKEFRDAVNKGNTFAGKSIKLTADVDLKGEEWIPIGNSTYSFNGSFDGQGHRISNLTVNGSGKSNQGLFGITKDREIKNLTIENAKVAGRLNVGVVAGTPYTSKYTNINVIGHVEIEGMAYVGGVGGKNAYANWTNITVNVDETSYVRANSIEDGKAYRTYVGGVCGFNGEGGHTFENITSNIDVTGTTIDVGGLFGIAHYGNNFKNCSSSGDVEITNAENAADAEEIGGIAGVWHNADGTNVNFTDCSFTGNLKVNVEGVDLSDNTIVGNAYSTAGTGTLIIDGNTFVSEGVFKDDKGEFHVSSKVGLKYFSNKTADNGTVINLDSDIDFGNEEFQAVAAGYSKSLVFKGHGHIIKNIKLVQCTHNSVGAASMFFCYPGGSITVEGLVIDNATSKGATYAGTILGYTQGNARLSNITVQNSNIEGTKKIGGLVGFVEASTTSFVAENCHIINTSVTATEKQAGTILGYNAKPATLKQCTVDSKTTATSPNYCDGGIRCTDPAQAELTIE